MEFENYERELKYLIKKNEKYTSKQFLEFLYENGYKLVESFEKEKHETYYDDNDFSILKRGDVMRGSNMVTEQFKGFWGLHLFVLYKKPLNCSVTILLPLITSPLFNIEKSLSS